MGIFIILFFSVKLVYITIATYIRKLKDSNGDYILPVTRSSAVYLENNTTLQNWIDKVAPSLAYPVGSIYQTESNTSPAALFGGGWNKIENRFLYAASTGTKVGTKGGEESHKLTKDELPAYDLEILPSDRGDFTYPGTYFIVSKTGQDAAAYVNITESGWGIPNWAATRISAPSGGGDMAHNNMPPYEAVNIWKRVS